MIMTWSLRSQKTKTTEQLGDAVTLSLACAFHQVAPAAAILGSSYGESLFSKVKGGWRFKCCQ